MTPEFCVMMLEAIRYETGLTQAVFAKCLKINVVTYSGWVTGRTPFNPHNATWDCILRAIERFNPTLPCHLCGSHGYCQDDEGGQLPLPPYDCPKYVLNGGMIDRR